jgi:hypothetical protein
MTGSLFLSLQVVRDSLIFLLDASSKGVGVPKAQAPWRCQAWGTRPYGRSALLQTGRGPFLQRGVSSPKGGFVEGAVHCEAMQDPFNETQNPSLHPIGRQGAPNAFGLALLCNA